MDEYDVKLHGDYLEQEASDFIRNSFPNYELVWKIYIGNRGNETKAIIPKYKDEEKRQKFAECSYTVLESMFMASEILGSQAFAGAIKDLKSYKDFHINYMAFFSNLGRIKDNIGKASNLLGLRYDVDDAFKEYFEARNIILHGKSVPLSQDEYGFPQIPKLYSSSKNPGGWSDKKHDWKDAAQMQNLLVDDVCSAYFEGVTKRVNDLYGVFYDIISKELKDAQTKITFEYNKFQSASDLPPFSGSVSNTSNGVSVYNINLSK